VIVERATPSSFDCLLMLISGCCLSTNARLIGRSVWNSQWKIVIPAHTLLNDEQAGMNHFAASVDDIKLFFRTYSNSGN
jgi:hypothetical protein